MRIGILQTGHLTPELVADYGSYGDMFQDFLCSQGLETQVYRIVDEVFPASLEEQDGWLVTGSRHGAYEDLPWIPPLEDLLRQIVAARLPLVGICFGHQIIAQALGGKVLKSQKGWGVGLNRYETEPGTPGKQLFAFHQDQVVELPPGARVLASSDFCPYAALAVEDRVLTYQAHPEFSAEFMRDLVKARANILPPEIVAAAQIEGPRDADAVASHIAAFFRLAYQESQAAA